MRLPVIVSWVIELIARRSGFTDILLLAIHRSLIGTTLLLLGLPIGYPISKLKSDWLSSSLVWSRFTGLLGNSADRN
jgi:hypothetical protein